MHGLEISKEIRKSLDQTGVQNTNGRLYFWAAHGASNYISAKLCIKNNNEISMGHSLRKKEREMKQVQGNNLALTRKEQLQLLFVEDGDEAAGDDIVESLQEGRQLLPVNKIPKLSL